MTRAPWPTPAQLTWLEGRLPAFVDAQQKKTTSSVFFPETHKLWQASFPTPEPTETEIEEAKGIDEAVAQKKKFWEWV